MCNLHFFVKIFAYNKKKLYLCPDFAVIIGSRTKSARMKVEKSNEIKT